MPTIRPLMPSELDTWFDFVARVFGVDRSYFVRHWQSDPDRRVDAIRIALVDGQIASTLRIFPRRIYLAGQPVTMGGIGEVCTDPAYRGQGLSGLLLDDAARFMAAEEMAVSLLFASYHSHYGRHGWQVVPMLMGLADLPASDREVYPADPIADGAQMRRLHGAYASRFGGAIVRESLDYWREWIPGEWKRAVTCRSAHGITAYLAANWTGPAELYIEDFATDDPALFPELVGALIRDRGLASATVRFPLAIAPHLPGGRVERNEGPMYRINRPDLLTREAAGHLDRMLRGEVADHLIFQSDWF